MPFPRCLALALLACATPVHAFCGFYVGKADAGLFNEASQVILVRDGHRTVISMLNDYKGEPTEFALVVPVPHVLPRSQINVGDRRIFDRIDAFSAPRLAEYYDEDPCSPRELEMMKLRRMAPASIAMDAAIMPKRSLGVTVEASYTVGEYDIVILSAEQSDGLETWLIENGYRIPPGASRALKPYIRLDMKFFVARINLQERARTGLTYLRPLQFAFESEKFMLPLRLGMVNARGPQDLIAFILTKNGRVEATNYRTVKLPANMDVPLFVSGEFNRFYKAMFDEQAKREKHRVVFTEYFWDMSWCDPCAAEPLTPDELRKSGVFWLNGDDGQGGASKVMLTRLHVRYTRATFPEDLMFQETADRENFQTRYVLRHPWTGKDECAQAAAYRESVRKRQQVEATTLASLTGWELGAVRTRMGLPAQPEAKWWERLWN
ncbi:MAG: DUF2330 domain-containing protein [Burkholderiales bacterium]|nr:DUF2330 domain-containing protein [Burkholderiales bacterium]